MNWRFVSWFVEQPAAERFDRIIEVLLAVLLAFSPLALGVVHAWSEEVVIVLAAGIGLAFLLKLVALRSTRFIWSWAYAPVAMFIALAAFQLMPLPASWTNRISPSTVAVKADLLGDMPNAREALSPVTLSFYSRATRHDLRLVLAAATVLVVVVNVYRGPERIKRLLGVVAGVGGVVALLALIQDVAGNGSIYWCVPVDNGACSGTFVNHNHFGQFMNLSMGAALGLLCVTLHEAFRGRYVTPAGVADYLASPAGRPAILLAAVIVLGTTTVFLSLTRGGMISTLIAAGFTTIVMSWRRSLRGQGWIMVLLATSAFICILYVGFDQVHGQLAGLRNFGRDLGGRWRIIEDVGGAWKKFPVFGMGLGTHDVVYPMFERAVASSTAACPENEYAQVAEEMGAAGLLSCILLGAAAWLSYGRSIRSISAPIRSAAYGLGFGLLAVLIHSLGDFGQRLPANAMLSAICVALLIALVPPERIEPSSCANVRGRTMRGIARLAVLVLAGGVWSWAVLGADSARRAQASWSDAIDAESRLEAASWRASRQAYGYLFEHATRAAALEPDNIQYRHGLAVYKWRSLTPCLDPNTGILETGAIPRARQIVEELRQTRPLCPTFGPSYGVAGEIRRFVLDDPNGGAEIRRGYRLAPNDAATCLVAARVDAEEGKIQDAFEKLARAIQLDGRCFPRAVRLCVDRLGEGDLALRLAGDDPDRLSCVADLLADCLSREPLSAGDPTAPWMKRRLLDRARTDAFDQLRRRCEKSDASARAHASLANLYRQRGELEQAIRHYRLAVRLDYDQIGWRCALAQLLAQTRSTQEAMHEAQICLRFNGDYAPAKELLGRLTPDVAIGGQSAAIR